MTEIKQKNTLDFSPVSIEHRERYVELLGKSGVRGCEFSFSNVFLWGRQSIAFGDGYAVLFSQFNRKSVYPFPIGNGDMKAALEAIISDSETRGITCRITGMTADERATLEALYPEKFTYHCDEGTFDYVYAVDDLADLTGKKYHSKRNHFNRFAETYEGYRVEPISSSNIEKIKLAADKWYEEKLQNDPHADIEMERVALMRALKHANALEMDGIALTYDGEIMAFTLGSMLSDDTFDVQFEKALSAYNGAYAAVNCEFARYLRDKYPNIKFLDREEDMGLEGLRKAKKSYHPHHRIEKCWAHLKSDNYDY